MEMSNSLCCQTFIVLLHFWGGGGGGITWGIIMILPFNGMIFQQLDLNLHVTTEICATDLTPKFSVERQADKPQKKIMAVFFDHFFVGRNCEFQPF